VGGAKQSNDVEVAIDLFSAEAVFQLQTKYKMSHFGSFDSIKSVFGLTRKF